MKAIGLRIALGNESDLITPTSTQNYPLGGIVDVEDSSKKSIKKYMYVQSHGILAANGIYILNLTGTAGSEVKTALSTDTSADKGTSYYNLPCIAEVAFASGYYGFVCVQGTTTVSTAGSVTDQHACKLGDAAATVATEGAVTVTAYTVGINRATRSGAGTTAFELIGQNKWALQYTAP